MNAPLVSEGLPQRRLPRRTIRASPSGKAANRGVSGAFAELTNGVEWSLSLVGFLYYFFVITTYWLPGADVAIVLAAVGLVFRIDTIRLDAVLLWFGAFVVWCLVSYMASPYQSESWPQTWEFVKVWIVVFVAANVMRTRANLRFFLAFAVGCFVLFPARGAFVNYFGGYSVWGRALWNFAYANPNDLAAFTLLYASMAGALFFECRNRLLRLGALSAVGVLLALVFFTQSRGALLAAGLVMASIVAFRLRNPRVVLGACAMVVTAAIVAPRSVWERLGGLAGVSVSGGMQGVDREGSAEQRFAILKVAKDIALANPVVGVGPGAYPIAHGLQALRRADLPLARGRRDAHNTYLRTVGETGFIGLGLLLSLLGTTLYSAWKASRQLHGRARDMIRMLSYGLVAYLLAGLFGSFTYLNVLYLHLMVLSAVAGFPAVGSRLQQVQSVIRRGSRLGAPPDASRVGAAPRYPWARVAR